MDGDTETGKATHFFGHLVGNVGLVERLGCLELPEVDEAEKGHAAATFTRSLFLSFHAPSVYYPCLVWPPIDRSKGARWDGRPER